jgi:hypothetical protein
VRSIRLAASGLAALVLLVLAPSALARPAANPTLDVAFFSDGQISVTLPDGTPVGSTTGVPSVIPAGYYSILMSGPGGCTQLPLFSLTGPGASIVTDMNGGEVDASSFNADFLPNSTYVWRTDRGVAAVNHTFTTTAGVVGTAGQTTGTTGTTSTAPATSQDIVGSGVVPFRGKLTAAVSAAGKLSLTFGGKSAAKLAAGKYTITVTDHSKTAGFVLESGSHRVTVTGTAFVGKRTASVQLTTGRWLIAPTAGSKGSPVAVA